MAWQGCAALLPGHPSFASNALRAHLPGVCLSCNVLRPHGPGVRRARLLRKPAAYFMPEPARRVTYAGPGNVTRVFHPLLAAKPNRGVQSSQLDPVGPA